MAWFHKKLKDLITAFEDEDWGTAEEILREHCIEVREKSARESTDHLTEAANHLKRYTETLTGFVK
ncbi:hypothetical protein HZB02_05950 [Candidatus Woesearchaeota archaeon]|nr:hypothetical protein [Candidatus Woesearchaeota archaeon]